MQIIIAILFDIDSIIFINQLMVRDLIVGNNVDLWDITSHMQKIHIGCGCCRNPTLIHVYGAFGMEYCIIISPLMVFLSMA